MAPQLSVLTDGEPPAAPRIRVVVAETHRGMRLALRALLLCEPRIEIIAEAEHAAEALAAVGALAPDVVVLDLRMPDGSSSDVIAEMRRLAPAIGTVVLTMHQSPLVVKQFMSAGASAVVLTDTAETDLVDAVIRAATGSDHLTPRHASGGNA